MKAESGTLTEAEVAEVRRTVVDLAREGTGIMKAGPKDTWT